DWIAQPGFLMRSRPRFHVFSEGTMLRSISVFSASTVLMLSACGPSGEDKAFSTDRSDAPLTKGEPGEGSRDAVRKIGGEAGGAGDNGEVAATRAGETMSTDAPPVVLNGAWISPSCGPRNYARSISFDAAGHFTAQDLISPCPRDVVCVWSGIIYHRGDYVV